MREYPGGATRDNVEGKLSYFKALSPEVLRRYVEYLAKHRKQADGQMRDWDNWKKGIPQDDYMDSLVRHNFDTWLTFLGLKTYENATLEDLLCAIIFNATGLLYERLRTPQPITNPRRMLNEARCEIHCTKYQKRCPGSRTGPVDSSCFQPKESAE